MLHITEDTPPDMLAGAMDLTVHLPNGRTVKMAVERSTPMMDLLVQITTNHHLQLSNHTLQVLGMAPSVEHSDKVLPFKPNTPIGALDTQHIKVLPKGKTLPAPKLPPPPGHQPFESTFRLKVHLPRNQLYVTRVSRHVHLEDIMRKVCEEKNLDPAKFELKHPGNLEETLDPKLTLSDYQITEIYLVHKGTSNLSQALSSTDIMTLRKEEERKQMHTKTGGGVFNLIFKRNKSSMGSGSISSDTRSLSPTHSDDSRSVTPPGVQAPPIVSPPKRAPPERPKPPQRKRRPAPKPPQASNSSETNQRVDEVEEKTPSEIAKATTDQSHSSAVQRAISENGLTICHSRNSSDSSGYHEASILSDHNASLPRTRPKSAFVTGEMQQMALASGSNLNNMAAHSKSTTSLVAGRKKRAPAPPPHPSRVVVPVSPSSSVVSASSEKHSPLVASQTTPTLKDSPVVQDSTFSPSETNPKPLPRKRIGSSESLNLVLNPPKPKPRRERPDSGSSRNSSDDIEARRDKFGELKIDKEVANEQIIEEIIKEKLNLEFSNISQHIPSDNNLEVKKGDTLKSNLMSEVEAVPENKYTTIRLKDEAADIGLEKTLVLQPNFIIEIEGSHSKENTDIGDNEPALEDMLCSLEAINAFTTTENSVVNNAFNSTIPKTVSSATVSLIQKDIVSNIFSSSEFLNESKPPEIVAAIPKSPREDGQLKFNLSQDIFSTQNSDSASDNRTEVFNKTLQFKKKDSNRILQKTLSTASLGSFDSDNEIPIKKWNNTEKLDDTSLTYFAVKNDWVSGGATDTESVTSVNTPLDTPNTPTDILTLDHSVEEEKTLESTDSGIAQDKQSDTEKSTEDLRIQTSSIEEHRKPEANLTLQTELCNEKIIGLIDSRIISSEKSQDIQEIEKSEAMKSILSPIDSNVDQTECVLENTKIESNALLQKTGEINQIPSKSSQMHQNVVAGKPHLSHPGIEKSRTEIRPSFLNLEPENETETFEIDWQYKLPSPPKAFRDSPTSLGGQNDCDTYSVSEFKDSVVTQPELFETSQRFEMDNTSETETLKSEVTSVASEEILNTLSLEHLEKRKSLVYNRELATSLKVTENPMFTRSSEENDERRKRNQTNSLNTLPNFKITTYNVPKQKIQVFEDDTVRSNVNNVSNLRKSANFAQSLENVSGLLKANKEHKEYGFFRPKISNYETSIQRSESFFTDRLSSKPVSRSQSHLTLNKFGDSRMEKSNSTFDVSGLQSIGVMRLIQDRLSTPTSSLENLSQTNHPPIAKAPSTTLQTLIDKHETNETQKSCEVEANLVKKVKEESEIDEFVQNETILKEFEEIKPTIPEPQAKVEKKYHYSGPPTINMATWSERPKVPVHVKEDADYKLGNHDNSLASKLIDNRKNLVNNNNINSVEVKNRRNSNDTANLSNSVSNVVIKINGQTSEITNKHSQFTKNFETSRFHAPLGYRKPFQSIEKNTVTYSVKQRPHSIAFDSDFDISRVPVVKSVEFKKPYKDIYTSVTHINSKNDESNHNNNDNDFQYKGTEHQNNNDNPDSKILRVNSFKILEHQAPPVVRGFRNSSNLNTVNHRFSWNPSSTLPLKSKPEINFTTNQHVPFSQSTLKRTESNRLLRDELTENTRYSRTINEDEMPFSSLPSYDHLRAAPTMGNELDDRISKRNVPQNYTPPPPPPQMPSVNLRKVPPKEHIISQKSPVDARDTLMESIRGFGGKKGLRNIRS